MRNTSKKKFFLIISGLMWSTFFLNPLLSLIYFLVSSKYKKYLYISLFMALFGAILIPAKSYDILRYYEKFDLLDSTTNFVENLKDQNDILVPTYYLFLKKMNLKKELIPFFSIFITYFLSLKIFYKIFKSNLLETKYLYLIYLIYFINIDFRGSLFGVRNTPAILLSIYGVYKYYIENKKIGLIYLILGSMTHIMTLIYIFILIFLEVIPKKICLKISKIIFLVSICGFFLTPKILENIIKIIPMSDSYKTHILYYITGYWATGYLEDANIKQKIFDLLMNFRKYWSILYLISLFNEKKIDSKFLSFTFFSMSISNFLGILPNLSGRYYVLPYYLSLIILLMKIRDTKKIGRMGCLAGITIIIYFLACIYEMKETYFLSFYKFFNIMYYFLFSSIDYKNYL